MFLKSILLKSRKCLSISGLTLLVKFDLYLLLLAFAFSAATSFVGIVLAGWGSSGLGDVILGYRCVTAWFS